MQKRIILNRKTVGTIELIFKDNNFNPPRNIEWTPAILFEIGKCSCYVIRKNWRGKYYIKETEVWNYVYSNDGWCYGLMDGRIIPAFEYGKRIFGINDLIKAKQVCSAKNGYKKVKVRKLRWPWRL